jgi:UDP-N-acetylglucosamine transferase subunit ALG13
MILLTVGTQFPFDRLVRAVDLAVEKLQLFEEIIAQTGNCSYIPRNFQSVPFFEKSRLEEYMTQATSIISHAGMGSIKTALTYFKPMLVMPRLKKYNEVVNDHQVMLAEEFEKLGYLLAAYSEEHVADKMMELKSFVPRKYELNTASVAARISNYLDSLAKTT